MDGKRYLKRTMTGLFVFALTASATVPAASAMAAEQDEQSKEESSTDVPNYTSFSGVAGETMYDTNGKQIQAHGGQIQQLTVDGDTKWYWIGEDKTNGYQPTEGIHLYSSEDLYNWTDEGVILRTMENSDQFETDQNFSGLYGDYTAEEKERIFIDLDKNNCVIERPKMLYNEKTEKYVIWFHADGSTSGSDSNYGKAKAGVAVSDSPTGPFRLLGSYKLNYHDDPDADFGFDGWEGRGSVRDMNLFKDDDGTAYVIYSSEGNRTMYISKLNEDYTQLAVDHDEAVEGTDFTRNFIGSSREAPAMFQYRDKYYLMTSGCTGWDPNQAKYAVADNPMGPWTDMGDPCTDEESETTYRTQSTCIFPVDAENGKYIYMGDRWTSGDLKNSRYVWLPVDFQPDDKIALRRYENWDLSTLDDKGVFDIKTELPSTASSVTSAVEQLPSELTISYGTDEETTPVTWEVGEYDENKLGTVTVKGIMTDKDRIFSHEIHVINPETLYFFDCGAETSSYFDALKKELGMKVKNDAIDQKYSEDNKAGFTGTTKEETPDSFDIARHDGLDYLENGWWAAGGKNIDYAFELQPGTYTLSAGFQEWWNTNREMKLTISMDDQVLAEQDYKLSSNDKDLQIDQPFEMKESGKVVASISKRGGADPVLSWIGVTGTENEEEPGEELLITSNPEDFIGSVEETATFAVEAEGTDLTYQWQYSNANQNIWRTSFMTGNNTDEISLPVESYRDGQKYRCVITDGEGNTVTSETASVKIGAAEGAPEIMQQPESYSGDVGDTAEFAIKANGENLTYEWQYCNADSNIWRKSSMEGNQTNTVSVPVWNFRERQKYRCVVTGKSGRITISDVVTVSVNSEN